MIDEKVIQRIYRSISDEYSRKVFSSRLLYSITGDDKILNVIREDFKALVLSDSRLKNLRDKLYQLENQFYVFGCGLYAKHFFELMPDLKPKGFLDSKSSDANSIFLGFPVYDIETFHKLYKNEKVIISSKSHYFEMLHSLENIGIGCTNIINGSVMWDIIEGRQYFDLPDLPHIPNEAFVDAGSLDGLSCVAFRDWCGDDCACCYCFEPDEKNRKKTIENFKEYGIDDYQMYDVGLWDRKETLLFDARGLGESRIVENKQDEELYKEMEGISEIPVISMDEVLSDKRVTFIKMDIEGSEKNALRGASRIISQQKPKLAICVYHKPEDIWEIPNYILSLNDDYKLYFRHYCYWGIGETVMYAV